MHVIIIVEFIENVINELNLIIDVTTINNTQRLKALVILMIGKHNLCIHFLNDKNNSEANLSII